MYYGLQFESCRINRLDCKTHEDNGFKNDFRYIRKTFLLYFANRIEHCGGNQTASTFKLFFRLKSIRIYITSSLHPPLNYSITSHVTVSILFFSLSQSVKRLMKIQMSPLLCWSVEVGVRTRFWAANLFWMVFKFCIFSKRKLPISNWANNVNLRWYSYQEFRNLSFHWPLIHLTLFMFLPLRVEYLWWTARQLFRKLSLVWTN